MITVKVEGIKELAEKLKLTAREITKTIRSTVDTTATAVKSLALDEAEKQYNISKARLRKTSRGQDTIYVKRSTQTDLSAIVTFKGGTGTKAGDRPGLHHYADKGSLKRGKGIYPMVRIKKDSGWKTIKGGFFQTMPNGGVGIFERIPDTRKIARRTGPGIKQIVENEEMNTIIKNKSREILQEKMRIAVAKVIA